MTEVTNLENKTGSLAERIEAPIFLSGLCSGIVTKEMVASMKPTRFSLPWQILCRRSCRIWPKRRGHGWSEPDVLIFLIRSIMWSLSRVFLKALRRTGLTDYGGDETCHSQCHRVLFLRKSCTKIIFFRRHLIPASLMQ